MPKLATQLAMSQSYLYDLEHDRRVPSVPMLQRLASFFGVTTDELMTSSEDTKKAPVSQAANEGDNYGIQLNNSANSGTISQMIAVEKHPQINGIDEIHNDTEIERLYENVKKFVSSDEIDQLCRKRHFTKDQLIARLKILGLKGFQGIALGFSPFIGPQGVQDVIQATEQLALKYYPAAEMSQEEREYINHKSQKTKPDSDLDAALRLRSERPEIIKLLADKDFTEAQIRALASAPRDEKDKG